MTQTLEETMRHGHEVALDWKREVVQEHGRDHPVPFVTSGYRGDEHVATFFPINRDKMLWVAKLAIGGFGCDRLTATVDAFGARLHSNINPDTKKPVQPGDFQRAFQQRRPWVREVMKTYAIDRVESRLIGMETGYKAKHRRIQFRDVHEFGDGELGGMVPRLLHSALDAPDIEFGMNELIRKITGKATAEVFSGLTPRQRRIHTDVVCIRYTAGQQIPVLYAIHDDEAKVIVDESLGDQLRNFLMAGTELNVETF